MTAPLTQAEIYLTKSLKVILPTGQGRATPETVATAVKNLQALGFGIGQPLWERLSTLSDGEVIGWYECVLPILRKMVGAHRTFEPMYPNFPRQVMLASDAELFFNAMTHYYGFMLSDLIGDPILVVLPHYAKEARPELDEFHELRWIELGSQADFEAIFTRLAGSNGSLSEADKEILTWFAADPQVDQLLPAKIPQKETLAFLVAALPNPEMLTPSVKTATDVLRVAVAMSQGDVSLAEPAKFRNFSKRERRFLLNCLEQAGETRTEDMLRWKPRWIRLGERLHPGDFKQRYPQTLAAFDTLRNNGPCPTFNSQIEQGLRRENSPSTLALLALRPGDFARRLDHVLRTHADQRDVLDRFGAVAPKVSTPVLLQVWCHFLRRDSIGRRAFFPKGNAAKVTLQEGPLVPLQDGIAEAAANGVRSVLVERFRALPLLGKVFIDPRLNEQFVPFSQRSASRSLRTIARGSRFDLPPGDTIRLFCWWKNLEKGDEWHSRVDIDLSASLYDPSWSHTSDVAYYNLKHLKCYHSGDITSAPEGACEFIDIGLPSVLDGHARYIAVSISSYSRQPFVALPECFAGWMMRRKPNSGEIFEPKTVQDKIDITAVTRTCVPIIIDVRDRKVIWADLGLTTSSQINNAARNCVGFSQIGRALVELKKPTLHDLFQLHAEARGEIVEDLDNADTVFGLHTGTVTAFDTGIIMSQYLA